MLEAPKRERRGALPPLSDPDRAEAPTRRMAGSRSERLETTAGLAAYLAPSGPGIAQVCRITRRRIVRDKESVETVYAITSLTPDQAAAARLLDLSRAHWGIENRRHCCHESIT